MTTPLRASFSVLILRKHLGDFGTDDGRLFCGLRGAPLATVTYTRLWARARTTAFGEELAKTSPLARRPYDLRHAAVSTWLNGGVSPTRVAAWAGHGVDVLLKICAKCIDGQEDLDVRRVNRALNQKAEAQGTPGDEGAAD